MSRFTTSVLLATALLGVLLWIVISIVTDLANAPDEPLALPQESNIEIDPALPRINSEAEFIAWFATLGYDFDALYSAQESWVQARGWPEPYAFKTPESPTSDYWEDGPDDAQLLILAGDGDLQAMHMLAVRSLMRDKDPLEALDWYDRAIVNGSIFAMLAVADLTLTLTDPALDEFRAQAEWQAAVEQLRNESPPPKERALAWSLAGVIMGGYGLMGTTLTRRIEMYSMQLDTAGIERACVTAQDYVLEVAATRRAQGNALFSFEPPPFSITHIDPVSIIPCEAPMEPLISMAGCARHDYVDWRTTKPLSAWVCTN
jgi:hypothetical protein